MAEIDTSIYKTTPPAPINLLQQFGQVVGIQNAQQQNRLLQQQQDLRAGMGAAYQAATDPVTGAIDTNKLLAATGQDPRTAWNQGDIVAQGQSNVTATASAQLEQLKNALAHTQAANGIIGGVLGNPNLGKTDMRQQIVDGVYDLVSHSDGKLTAKQAREAIIPTIPTDPQGQLQWVRDKANQNLSLQGRIQEVLGSPTLTNTGPSIVQTRTPAAGGAMMQTGSLATATGPETQAQLVPTFVKQPDGTYQQVMVPRSTLPGSSGAVGGGNRLTAPQATPAPTAAPAPSAAPATAAPAGQVLAAPPPGVEGSQNADIAKYKGDQALIPDHATNVQSLQKAKGALEAVGTGKGSGGLNTMLSYINTIDPTGAVAARVQNYDEAKKYLMDYARKQGAAAHSDLQLQASEGSNASTDISNAAALDVVKTNIGRERQAIAQVQEHANPTGIGYGAHAANFATKTDPRAFAWDQYTPDERKKILSGLSGSALTKFKDSIVIANRLGLIRVQ